MSDAGTGLELMPITVSKQTIPFTEIVMLIVGNDWPPFTSPLSKVCLGPLPTERSRVICCCTASCPPRLYLPDPVIRVSVPLIVTVQFTLSTRYQVNSGSWWSKVRVSVPRMSFVVNSGQVHGG